MSYCLVFPFLFLYFQVFYVPLSTSSWILFLFSQNYMSFCFINEYIPFIFIEIVVVLVYICHLISHFHLIIDFCFLISYKHQFLRIRLVTIFASLKPVIIVPCIALSIYLLIYITMNTHEPTLHTNQNTDT